MATGQYANGTLTPAANQPGGRLVLLPLLKGIAGDPTARVAGKSIPT